MMSLKKVCCVFVKSNEIKFRPVVNPVQSFPKWQFPVKLNIWQCFNSKSNESRLLPESGFFLAGNLIIICGPAYKKIKREERE